MDIIPQKRCVMCEQYFPETSDHFYSNGMGGLRPRCKTCHSIFSGSIPIDRTVPDGTKKCSTCKIIYPATSEYFAHTKAGKYGLRSVCKSCSADYRKRPEYIEQRRLRESTPEYKAKKREYHELPHVKQHRREYNQSPSHRQYMKEYTKNNPQIFATKGHNRRARRKGLGYSFTKEQQQSMLEYWDYKCAVCGAGNGMWVKVVCDHWIALSDPRPDNPGTVATNIIPLCHSLKGSPSGSTCCNNSKHNRNAQEWLTTTYGKRKANKILKRIQEYFNTL